MTTSPSPTTKAFQDSVDHAVQTSQTDDYLSQTRCVDLLLDCFNVAETPAVKAVIEDALTVLSHVKLVKSSDFQDSLAQIQLAHDLGNLPSQLEASAS